MASPAYATEIGLIEQWLYGTLSGDQQLRALVGDGIYPELAEEGAAYPFLVYQCQSALDWNTQGGHRAQVNAIYAVKAFGQGSGLAVQDALMARVDTLIGRVEATIGLARIASSTRQSLISLGGTNMGIRYRQLIGTYAIQAIQVGSV